MKKNAVQTVADLSSTKSSAQSASSVAGVRVPSSPAEHITTEYNPSTGTTTIKKNGQTVARYTGNTLNNSSTYTITPSSYGQYTYTSGGYLSSQTTWNPPPLPTWVPAPTYPVAPPFAGQVIQWGGKVYYQPSDKMRALVDALRLV